MAISNKIGAPVIGEDFYGREFELVQAHRYLDERQALLLSAPRRIGKSSFAKRLIQDKKAKGWKCIYIDLEGIATKETFLSKLIGAFSGIGIFDKAGNRFKEFLNLTFSSIKGINFGPINIDLSNNSHSQALFNQLSNMFDHDNDVLIVIDELPLFLGKLMGNDDKNRQDVDFMLNWFRSIRQHENSKIRWIFCGSVGLRNFTNYYRMSQSINDLVEFPLGELPESEAKGLISALAKSYDLQISNRVISEMIKQLQWPIPYFIQLLIDRLRYNSNRSKNNVIKTADITETMSDLSHSDYFITWAERLDEYRYYEPTAREILNSLSVAENGLNKDQLLAIVMKEKSPATIGNEIKNMTKTLELLEHDGYIIRNGEYRKFRSPLLRMWWRYKNID